MNIDIRKYDLRKREDVRRLGQDIGKLCAQDLLPVVDVLEADDRIIFYAMFLASMAGGMAAAGGVQLADAVLDNLKLATAGAVADEMAKLN